jgi:hypothetical protein
MGIALAILWITMLVVMVCAAIVAIRQLWSDTAKALKRQRFGLVDLLLLMTVLCAGAAVARWFWDSIYLGLVLLLIPMSAPLPWVVKFSIEDALLRRQKRRERAAIVVTDFEVPIQQASGSPSKLRSSSWLGKTSRTWIPPLSPLSLSQKPLDSDD